MKIYVMEIHHRHGTNFYAHKRHEGIMDELKIFVNDWWHEVFPDKKIPSDKEDAISAYFDAREDEYYDIQETELDE